MTTTTELAPITVGVDTHGENHVAAQNGEGSNGPIPVPATDKADKLKDRLSSFSLGRKKSNNVLS